MIRQVSEKYSGYTMYMRYARTTNEWPYHHKCADIGAIMLQMCLCEEMLSELSS